MPDETKMNGPDEPRGNRRALTRLAVWVLVLASILALFMAVGGRDAVRRAYYRLRLRGKLDGEVIENALIDMYDNNPDARVFVENYDGERTYDPDTAAVYDDVDLGQRGTVPYFVQWDARWGYCRYGDGLMGWTGCGPTALAMVLAGLTGDGTYTPGYVAEFAVDNGYCVPGNGTSWTLFSQGAEDLGLVSREIPLWEGSMKSELSAGRPIICIMGPGTFTSTGHYIVISGWDDDGFYVLDPYRPSNCGDYSYEALEGEIKNIWSYELGEEE